MDIITIQDLEVHFHVGVPADERVRPQRLLIAVEMELNFKRAAATDDLTRTIDYFAVCQRIKKLGENREWKLIEKLAGDIGQMILKDFQPAAVAVEVKKFIIPETRWVSVKTRCAGARKAQRTK